MKVFESFGKLSELYLPLPELYLPLPEPGSLGLGRCTERGGGDLVATVQGIPEFRIRLEMGELNLKSQIAGSLKITFLLFQKLSRLFSIVSLAGKYCPPRGC